MRRPLHLTALLCTLSLVAAAPLVTPQDGPTATGDAVNAPVDAAGALPVDAAGALPGDAAGALPGDVVHLPGDETVELTSGVDLRGLLLDEVRPGDQRSLVSAIARHVGDLWDTDVVVIDDPSDPTEEEPAPEPVPVEPDEPVLDAWIAGHADVDGDGAEDLLLHVVEGGRDEIRALRGRDGVELWRVDRAGTWLGWPAGDLTGDGTVDFFDYRLDDWASSSEEDCDEDGCSERHESTWTWELLARSGADGAPLWSRSGTARSHWELENRSTEDGWEYRRHVEFTGWGGYPWPTADHDGDGGRDVVLNLVDLTSSSTDAFSSEGLVSSRSTGSRTFDATTDANVVRGADGTTAFQVTSSGAAFALLQGAGDATADGTEDLLWQREEVVEGSHDCTRTLVVEECEDEPESGADGWPVLALELLDGATLAPVWTSRHEFDPWYGGATPVLADLDGTPGTDVLMTVVADADDEDALPLPLPDDPTDAPDTDDPFAPPPQRLLLLSGADGVTTWDVPAPRGGLHTIGDLDGDGGSDLLFSSTRLAVGTSCQEDDCTYEASATLFATSVDGGDGTLLADHTRTWDLGDEEYDYSWFAFGGRVADHDGDGVRDLAINMGTSATGLVAVQAAASGALLFEDLHDGADPHILQTPPGDLDADGGDELAVLDVADWSTDVFAMPSVDLLHVFADDERPRPAGDQDGRPGDEFARVLCVHEGDEVSVVVEVVHGVSLAPLWSVELGRVRAPEGGAAQGTTALEVSR